MDYFKNTRYKNLFEEENIFYKVKEEKKIKILKDEIINERSDVLYIISAINLLYINMKNIIALLEMDDNYTNIQKKELLIGR